MCAPNHEVSSTHSVAAATRRTSRPPFIPKGKTPRGLVHFSSPLENSVSFIVQGRAGREGPNRALGATSDIAPFRIRVHERKHGFADFLWQVRPGVYDSGEFGGKVAVR